MRIDKESLETYANDLLQMENISPVRKGSFSFNNFIKLNYYLLCKSSSFTERPDLLITLRARRDLPNLLCSVFHYVRANYGQISLFREIPGSGDFVFYDDKVWTVKHILRNTAVIIDFIEKREKSVPVEKVCKIGDTRYKYKRRIIDFADGQLRFFGENVMAYYEWLSELKKKFSKLDLSNEKETLKQGKVLVITPYSPQVTKLISELSSIPFQFFLEEKVLQTSACSSYESLIDIYTSYDIAKNTKQINEEYEEIIVVGRRTCNKYLSELIRLRSRNRIHRFALITTDELETNYPFTEWHWAKEEINLLLNRDINSEIKLKVTEPFINEGESNGVEELQKHVQFLISELKEVKLKYSGIRLEQIYYLVNEYLRFILPPGDFNHTSRTYLEGLHKRTEDYLAGEEFKDAFYEVGVYRQHEILEVSQCFAHALLSINSFFYRNSPKYYHVQKALRDTEEHEQFKAGRHIIAPRDVIEDLRSFSDFHNQEILVGTIPLFDKKDNISFDRIVDSQINTTAAQFIFPFIFSRAQYESMLEANGDVNLYLYDQLEDYKYVKILEAYERRFLKKIQHPDRKLFTASEYQLPIKVPLTTPDPENGAEENLKILFGRYNSLEPNHKDFFEQLFNSDGFEYQKEAREIYLRDNKEYEIIFEDGEILLTPGTRRIIHVESNESGIDRHCEIPLSQVDANQVIILYRNQSKELLYQILLEQDKSGVMKEIERASNLWLSTLQEIRRKENDDFDFVKQLLQWKNIFLTNQTLRGYFKKDRKFPKDTETLEAIRQIAIERGLSENYLTTKERVENILRRKAQYQSLSITLGREISDEVLHFHLTGKKGDLLEKLDSDVVEVLRLNIKQGRVKNIKVK